MEDMLGKIFGAIRAGNGVEIMILLRKKALKCFSCSGKLILSKDVSLLSLFSSLFSCNAKISCDVNTICPKESDRG